MVKDKDDPLPPYGTLHWDPNYASTLPLEPAHGSLHDVMEDPVTISQYIGALDDPSSAIHLICRDVLHLRILGRSGGLCLFSHRQRPTVFVHIVGRIVGVDEKEKRIHWFGG